MSPIRIALATLALAAAGAAHASEVTEFAAPSTSNVTRGAVRADAQAAAKAGLLRHDEIGTSVMPMSVRMRTQVRAEALAVQSRPDPLHNEYFVGGM